MDSEYRSSCVTRPKSSSTADTIAAADLSDTLCLSQAVEMAGKFKLVLGLLFEFLFFDGVAWIILAKGRSASDYRSLESHDLRP